MGRTGRWCAWIAPWSDATPPINLWYSGPDMRWYVSANTTPPPGPAPTIRKRKLYTMAPTSPAELWRDALHRAPARSLFGLIAVSASVAAFAVLPFARRRAKVRFAHLARAWCYALIGPFWILMWIGPRSFHPAEVVNVMFAIVLLTVWWRLAAGRYLQMERPWAVAASVATIGVLAGWTAVRY